MQCVHRYFNSTQNEFWINRLQFVSEISQFGAGDFPQILLKGNVRFVLDSRDSNKLTQKSTHSIGQHIPGPFHLQQGDLLLVQILVQLLDHARVRAHHAGDHQQVDLAVLQRELLATKRNTVWLIQKPLNKLRRNLLHKCFNVLLQIFVVQRAVQTALELGHDLLLVRIVPDQLLLICRWKVVIKLQYTRKFANRVKS